MITMKLDYPSKALGIHTKVNIVLPQDRGQGSRLNEGCLYQVLWLLHGGTDDENDYILNTNVARYADESRIAVIMPEDDNAFYTDGYIENGGRYFTYVTEELVEMCRSILPISAAREDNFIAGHSMGAGGAMKCAVLHPELYRAALIMSGSGMRMHRKEDAWVAPFLDRVMSGDDMSDIVYPEDPKRDVQMAYPIYRILKEKKADLPEFFFTCGGNDMVLDSVKKGLAFYDYMGLPYFYEEVPGYRHEWDFWDMQLRKALKEWLPLKHDVIRCEGGASDWH